MISNTKEAIKSVAEDFKRALRSLSILMQSIYILYLLYAIIMSSGVLIANIILIIISGAYFALYILSGTKRGSWLQLIMPKSKKILKICTLTIKAFTLAIALYGIYTTVSESLITPIYIVLNSLMIVLWILQVLLEIIIAYGVSKFHIITAGINADFHRFSNNNLFKESEKEGEIQTRLKTRVIATKAAKKAEKKLLKKEKIKNAANRLKSLLPKGKAKSTDELETRAKDKHFITK